jgi:hypothetical protein
MGCILDTRTPAETGPSGLSGINIDFHTGVDQNTCKTGGALGL